MSRKHWGILTLSLTFFCLLSISVLVIAVDPFEIYHRATAFIPPIENSTQLYSNAGIARNYDYDSIIVGSSMTENFVPSQLDSLLGGSFVKLSVSGSTPYNLNVMMGLAFRSRDISRVLCCIDVSSFNHNYDQPISPLPTYLYDENPFNDVRYWLNGHLLVQYLPRCFETLGQHDDMQRDTMYAWGDLFDYGKDAALSGIRITSDTVMPEPPERAAQLSDIVRTNLTHNILPFLDAHPETEFLFFFPPYSLANWYSAAQHGTLNYYLGQKEAMIEALLRYDNVRIYDFQAQTDWITDLDNYKDSTHYGPWISEAMVRFISEDRCRILSLQDAKGNDAVIREGVRQIISAGEWPDAFTF